mmetsp:Transcript_47154/g.53455  ORF Transcript_47154/g.53455 Transcript_47154/m.53455 type:complete len:284 (+) Transcript_47154:109-960(+)
MILKPKSSSKNNRKHCACAYAYSSNFPYHRRRCRSNTILLTIGSMNTADIMNSFDSQQQQQDYQLPIDVIGPSEIFEGTLIAFALVFVVFFLQGRRNGIHNVALLDSNLDTNLNLNTTITATTNAINKNISIDSNTNINDTNKSRSGIVFDGESWKEMSKPENYILFNRRIKQSQKQKRVIPTRKKIDRSSSLSSSSSTKSELSSLSNGERRWVLISLLLLFIPIFSAEFFFASSRQFICDSGGGGNSMNMNMNMNMMMMMSDSSNKWSDYLCSPANASNLIP